MEFVASCKSEVLITPDLLWREINFPLSNIILENLEVVAATIDQTLYLITVIKNMQKGHLFGNICERSLLGHCLP